MPLPPLGGPLALVLVPAVVLAASSVAAHEAAGGAARASSIAVMFATIPVGWASASAAAGVWFRRAGARRWLRLGFIGGVGLTVASITAAAALTPVIVLLGLAGG